MIEQKIQIPTAGGTTEGVIYFPGKDGALAGRDSLHRHRRHSCFPGANGAAAGRSRLRRPDAQRVLPHPRAAAFRFPLEIWRRAHHETTGRTLRSSDRRRPSHATPRITWISSPGTIPSSPAPWAWWDTASPARWRCYTAYSRPDRIAAAASFHAGGLATDAPDSPHLALQPFLTARLYFGHADQRQKHAGGSHREAQPRPRSLGRQI